METIKSASSRTTSEQVADNLRRIRQKSGVDLRTLDKRLEKLGHRISSSGLSKIENGERKVAVDELIALAVALGVTPLHLLRPVSASDRPTAVSKDYAQEEVEVWLSGKTELTNTALQRFWHHEAQTAERSHGESLRLLNEIESNSDEQTTHTARKHQIKMRAEKFKARWEEALEKELHYQALTGVAIETFGGYAQRPAWLVEELEVSDE